MSFSQLAWYSIAPCRDHWGPAQVPLDSFYPIVANDHQTIDLHNRDDDNDDDDHDDTY